MMVQTLVCYVVRVVVYGANIEVIVVHACGLVLVKVSSIVNFVGILIE
jgi:hypothetical protein